GVGSIYRRGGRERLKEVKRAFHANSLWLLLGNFFRNFRMDDQKGLHSRRAEIFSQTAAPSRTIRTVDHCRTYLTKTLRIDMSDARNYRKRLLKYRGLRNTFVHHGGLINVAHTVAFLKTLKYV